MKRKLRVIYYENIVIFGIITFFTALFSALPNNRFDDTIFLYFPAIWSFPNHFEYITTFTIPYHILYCPSIWIINKIYNLILNKNYLYIETAYVQSVIFSIFSLFLFYKLLRLFKRQKITSWIFCILLGFSYVFWAYSRMFSSGAIIFTGTVLGLYATVYFIEEIKTVKNSLYSGALLAIGYLLSQTVIFIFPVILFLIIRKALIKKDLLNTIVYLVTAGTLVLIVLSLLYKFEWKYDNYSDFIPRILGRELGVSINFNILSYIKEFKDVFFNISIAITGLFKVSPLITVILHIILLVIVINNYKNESIIISVILYVILFVLAPYCLNNDLRYLKYWMLFLIPVFTIVSFWFDKINFTGCKFNKNNVIVIFLTVLTFILELNADFRKEKYPQVWSFRDKGRGIISKSDYSFYNYIIKNTPEKSIIFHDENYYYANIITFTQRYSRSLEYALKNKLIINNDIILSSFNEANNIPKYLLSPYDVNEIYIFDDKTDYYYCFALSSNESLLFDGYYLKLFKFIGINQSDSNIKNKIIKYYTKSADDNNENKHWVRLFMGMKNQNKYLIISPNILFDINQKIILFENIIPVAYPSRI